MSAYASCVVRMRVRSLCQSGLIFSVELWTYVPFIYAVMSLSKQIPSSMIGIGSREVIAILNDQDRATHFLV